MFPKDPGGGSGDLAFLRYHVVANEETILRLGVMNDPDDSLRLWQGDRDRLILHSGRVTVGDAPYVAGDGLAFNVVGGVRVKGGAIVPEVGNSESAGIMFPKDPGGGSGDVAFLRYSVESGEETTLRLGIGNDPNDTLRLYQAGGDRLVIHDSMVTIGSVGKYAGPSGRYLNVEGEIRSFGGGAGVRMSDRKTAQSDEPDWVMYPFDGALRFWSGGVDRVWINSNTLCTRKLRLHDKWILSGDGDGEADDGWLRLKGVPGSGRPMYPLNYFGGFAAWLLWSDRGAVQGSDRSRKRDITTLESSLAKICRLRGVRFRWTHEDDTAPETIGVVAQEVEEVLPELVQVGPDGTKGVHYDGLIGPLIEAIKEQQAQIAALQAALAGR
jgi:hypothetical protein